MHLKLTFPLLALAASSSSVLAQKQAPLPATVSARTPTSQVERGSGPSERAALLAASCAHVRQGPESLGGQVHPGQLEPDLRDAVSLPGYEQQLRPLQR